jgi:hypothetical protein
MAPDRAPDWSPSSASEAAGLVTTTKVGRVRTCHLGPRRLQDERAWLESYRQRGHARFCELNTAVEELTRKEASHARRSRQ